MNHVLITLIGMSIAGTLIICALLLIDAIALRKGPKRFLYYAWILVIMRLPIPVGLTTQEVAMPSILDEHITVPATTHQVPDETVSLSVGAEHDTYRQTKTLPVASVPDETTQSTQDTDAAFFSWLAANPWCIWLTGAALMLLIKILRYRRFTRGVRMGATTCDDIALLDRVAQLGEKIGVSKPVELCVNPAITSPMLLGTFRPMIVIPSVDLPAEDLDYILLHELSHLRRWDTVYKWAVQVAVCVHWFNPMVYIMSRQINRCCELACDEDVLRQHGCNPYEYGTTLLRAMWMGGPLTGRAGSIELGENKKLLKERVEIMAKNTKSIGTTIISAFLVGCLLLCTSCVRVVVPVIGRNESRTIVQPTHETAKAGSVLDLQMSKSAVIVELTEDNEVTASYSAKYNDVNVSTQGDTTRVTCKSIPGRLRVKDDEQLIILSVPATAFDTISLNVEEGFIGWYELPGSAVTANMDESAAVLTLPEDFKGSLNVTALDSALMLSSQDAYANCDVTIQNENGFMTGPTSFSRVGNTARYEDGTDGTVDVESKNGFVAISDSDELAATVLAAASDGLVDIQSSLEDIVGEMPALEQSQDSNSDNWIDFGCVDGADIELNSTDFEKHVEDWASNLANNTLRRVETRVNQVLDEVSKKLSDIGYILFN